MGLRVKAIIGTKDYETTLHARAHAVVSDEPSAQGGQDRGPGPTELVLMGLGACTSITLRMYAKRKGWDLQGVESDLEMSTVEGKARIERRITLRGALDQAQRARLLQIANACPVHKLKGPVGVTRKDGVTAFCRCGASGNKPYCDGSHARVAFEG